MVTHVSSQFVKVALFSTQKWFVSLLFAHLPVSDMSLKIYKAALLNFEFLFTVLTRFRSVLMSLDGSED